MSWTVESFTIGRRPYHQRQKAGLSALGPTPMEPRQASTAVTGFHVTDTAVAADTETNGDPLGRETVDRRLEGRRQNAAGTTTTDAAVDHRALGLALALALALARTLTRMFPPTVEETTEGDDGTIGQGMTGHPGTIADGTMAKTIGGMTETAIVSVERGVGRQFRTEELIATCIDDRWHTTAADLLHEHFAYFKLICLVLFSLLNGFVLDSAAHEQARRKRQDGMPGPHSQELVHGVGNDKTQQLQS